MAGPTVRRDPVELPVVALSVRSLKATARQPQNWLPSTIFPLVLAAVYTAQFGDAVNLESFGEVDSFLEFLLPASVLQGVTFAATNGASDLAIDLEDGFFERLLASPVRPVSILVGRLAGAAVLAVFQALVLMAVFVAFGADISAAVVPAVAAAAVMLALSIGAVASALAFWTGNQESVQSLFPVTFIGLFISSAFFPTEAMSGWYRWLAERNPVTFLIDPTRRLVLDGPDGSDLAMMLGVGLAMTAAGVTLALAALRYRLRETS